MNILKLKEIFLKAKLEGLNIGIELTIPGRKETEIIIIKYSNLDYKLNYYTSNYNEQLILNRCKDIKIINAYVIDNKIIKGMKGEK